MATTFDKASLVMIPSGVKEDKLYSIKPTDGSGDFTFSRGSDIEATRVNSSGLIEKAKVNLALQSNTFNTTWLPSNASVTSGQSGYDGSSDAWLLTKSAAYGSVYQTGIAVDNSSVYTFSAYMRAGTQNFGSLRFWTNNSGADFRVKYDLTTGEITTASANNGTRIDATATAVGATGWWRVSVTGLTGQTAATLNIYAGDTADASGTIYIQDAALCHGLVAQDYVETTTTAVVEGLTADLPRLDYSGGASCPSLLLEPSRTNVIPHSEYLGSYGVSNVSVSYNNDTSPEGVQNATLVTGDSGTLTKVVNFNPASNGAYTISVFAKYNTHQWIQLGMGGVATYANFDIQNGVKGSTNGTSDIEDYGNGWYRCSVQMTTGTPLSHYIGMVDSSSASRLATSTSTNSFWAYGMQSEIGSYPTSYIPTYGTAAVRGVDDMDTATLPAISGGEVSFFLDIDGAYDPNANSTSANFQWYFTSGHWVTWNNNTSSDHRIRVTDSGGNEYFTLPANRTERCKVMVLLSSTNVKVVSNGVVVASSTISANWSTTNNLSTSITNAVGVVPIKTMLVIPYSFN